MKRLWIRVLAGLPIGEVTVLIVNGRAERKRGAVHSGLLGELAELVKANGIEVACIHASRDGRGARLMMYGIPRELRQRVRNVWGANWR